MSEKCSRCRRDVEYDCVCPDIVVRELRSHLADIHEGSTLWCCKILFDKAADVIDNLVLQVLELKAAADPDDLSLDQIVRERRLRTEIDELRDKLNNIKRIID